MTPFWDPIFREITPRTIDLGSQNPEHGNLAKLGESHLTYQIQSKWAHARARGYLYRHHFCGVLWEPELTPPIQGLA